MNWRVRTLCFLLLFTSSLLLRAQQYPLSDDDARELVAAVVKKSFPADCVRATRKENFEDAAFDLRADKIKNGKLNQSIYFYEVDNSFCYKIVEEKGKPTLQTTIVMHEGSFGYVAVDRLNGKTYWFRPSLHDAEALREFLHDLGVCISEVYDAQSAASLYIQLVRGPYGGNDIYDETQLRRLVEDNFASAYSPYGVDRKWEPKFKNWWAEFRAKTPKLEFGTTSERVSEGVLVHGLAFEGFRLTVPRMDPPPKGTPTVKRWTLVVKPDGSVEEREPKVIYSKR